MGRRQRSNNVLAHAGLLILGFAFAGLLTATRHVVASPQAEGHIAKPAAASSKSRITSISETGSYNLGKFNGVGYERTWGIVTGVVSPGENVHGLAALDHDADGNYQYTAEFEIIAPVKEGTNSVIVVEAENRGSPILLGALHEAGGVGPPSSAMYPFGMGNGFLFNHATSYARVQWQYGFAAGVPKNAEGVGEVIMRDFGRVLAGHTKPDPKFAYDPGTYRTVILAGISQSAFYIDTFLAEGFNADPETGRAVFDGVIAIDGVGAWLALNQLATENGSDEYPYVVPNGKPLTPSELLKRPQSDPFYIDVANYTDFYRLRASVTDTAERPERMRRYDWPGPHAAARLGSTSSEAGKCDAGGSPELNSISYRPYLRAVLLALEHTLGVPEAKNAPELPANSVFKLGPAPSDTSHFNPLPGVGLQVPVVDQDDQPVGGVRFPDVLYPTGRPVPVSLSPTATSSIDQTCGNRGGWKPFTPEELAHRYGDQANYLKLYGASLDKLISSGYLLASDREEMLKVAALRYANP